MFCCICITVYGTHQSLSFRQNFNEKQRNSIIKCVFFLFGLILEADNYCSLRGEEWDMKNPKRDQTDLFRVYFSAIDL